MAYSIEEKMKNVTLMIALFCFMSTSLCHGQIVKSVGLNAGYVYAAQDWHYAPQTGLDGSWIDPISTFTGGIFAESFDVLNFSIFAKLQYVGKGRSMNVIAMRADPNSPQGYVDLGYQVFKERLDYICVPVLLKYRIALPVVEPFIAIGPRLEYLVGHASSVVYNKFKKTGWTGTLSSGAEVSIPSFPKFFIEAEYNTSLTDSYQGEFVTISDHSIELLVGVFF
jgi:hypothetical protein